MDFCCIRWTKMSSKDSGNSLPHSPLRAAAAAATAAAGDHPRCSGPLPHRTDYQIQFSLWPNGIITQSVLI